MTISDDTYKRMRDIEARVAEVMGMFKVSREEAFTFLCANGAYKAAEVAARIERAQRRSLSALANTFKANTADD